MSTHLTCLDKYLITFDMVLYVVSVSCVTQLVCQMQYVGQMTEKQNNSC